MAMDYDAARLAYVQAARAKKARKRALIAPGTRWGHEQNRHLFGTVEKLFAAPIPGPDPGVRELVQLRLDGTHEVYLCPPEQLVDSWYHIAPVKKAEPRPAPPPDTESSPTPAAPTAAKKKRRRRRSSSKD